MAGLKSPGVCTSIIDESGAVTVRSSSCGGSSTITPEPTPPTPTPPTPEPDVWILETGSWNDEGIWIDTAIWNDTNVAVN